MALIETEGLFWEVKVQGDYAYLVGSDLGLKIFNVSDPENPEEVGSYDAPNQSGITGISVVGDLAYVAVSGGGGLRILNVSDRRNPHEVGIYEAPGSIHSFVIEDNHAYILQDINRQPNLYIVNISDVDNPEEVWSNNWNNRFKRVTVSNDFAYMTGDSLLIFDVSDPQNTTQTGSLNFQWGSEGVVVAGDMAYIITYSSGFQFIAVGDPENPYEVGRYSPTYGYPRIGRLDLSNNNIYAVNLIQGLQIVDINNPEDPVEMGVYIAPDYTAFDVASIGSHAYLAADYFGLRTVNISDPDTLEEVGFIDDLEPCRTIAISGDYAYLPSSAGLKIVIISDPNNPIEAGQPFELGVWVEGITISDEYAYVARNLYGILVISISDPENIEEVGFFAMPSDRSNDGPRSVIVSGEFAYVASGWNGLRVISILDPTQPHEVGYFDTPGLATDVLISEDGSIIVADEINIGIYRFTDPNSVNEYGVMTPLKYKIHAAYPNPFNAQTRITYDLPASADVRLSIIDLNGRMVDVLDQGMKTLGLHRLIWDGSGFVSGTYFVRLEAGGATQSRTVVLVK